MAVPEDERLRSVYAGAAPGRAYDYFRATLPAGTADEDVADLWSYVGDELLELERRTEALDAYRRATLAQPDQTQYLESLACAHFRFGEKDESLATLRRAAALEPDDTYWSGIIAEVTVGHDPW
jgi:tetratricopeptide (TPR) repeat protein